MKEYYFLKVKDSDDDYIYDNFLYDNLEDYEKAIKVIEEVNCFWYSDDFEDNEETDGGFYEYMIVQLRKNNLLGLKCETFTKYVR